MVWMEQLRETIELENFEIKNIQLKDTIRIGENSVDGISVQVSETNRDLYTSEILSSEIQYLLLRNVQGEYHIYFDQRRVLSSMAKNHIIIGAMYIDGMGKDKDLSKGTEHFQKALEIDPTLIEAHYSLGTAYLANREWEQAIVEEEAYLTNSQDDEGRGEAYNIIGLAYQEMGDRAKAREAFEKAVQLNPESPFALNHLNELING
ncbi:tetratricopeptide repeat protein [Desulfosporosinus metallidurans]